MPIDIGGVFSDGIDAFLSKKALVLAGVFVVVGVLGSVAGDSLGLAALDWVVEVAQQEGESLPPDALAELERQREQLAWGVDVGIGPALALIAVSFLVGELVRIAAVRALADDTTDALERRHYAENVLSIFLNRVGVAIVVAILLAVTALVTVAAPAALFPPLALIGVVPLLYVAIGLYFASFAVTIDEVGVFAGLERGWNYAKGNRLRLAVVAIGVGIVQFVIGLPTLLFADLSAAGGDFGTTIQRTPGALVVTALVGGVSVVFQLAVASRTYEHLAGRANGANGPDSGESDGFAGETQF